MNQSLGQAEISLSEIEHYDLYSCFPSAVQIAKKELDIPEEKRDLLINKVQDNVFTIFAQIAYFQYEKQIHKAVQEKGYVSKDICNDKISIVKELLIKKK